MIKTKVLIDYALRTKIIWTSSITVIKIKYGFGKFWKKKLHPNKNYILSWCSEKQDFRHKAGLFGHASQKWAVSFLLPLLKHTLHLFTLAPFLVVLGENNCGMCLLDGWDAGSGAGMASIFNKYLIICSLKS